MIRWEALRGRNRFYLALDLLMLMLALFNVTWLGFDASYLYLRDQYLRYAPLVVEVYDPVKGVEQHRFTYQYLDTAHQFFASFQQQPGGDPALRQEMIDLSRQMLSENPFLAAHKSGHLERIKAAVRRETGLQHSSTQAFEAFWRGIHRGNAAEKEAFFRRSLEPLLAANYWRGIDLAGQPIDYFDYVNLVFIAIFLAEFLVRWRVAIRDGGDEQRILYPLYHWYDVLSFIPVRELAFLRLLRVLSVYIRLVQSDVIVWHEGPVVRAFRQLADIVLEEISDQVSLRILTDIQEKVKLGVTDTLVEGTLLPHKQAIRQVFLENLVKFQERALADRQDEWVELLAPILRDTIRGTDYYQRLCRLPLVGGRLERMASDEATRRLAGQVVANFSRAVEQTIHSEEGKASLGSLIDDLIDEVILVFREPLLKDLVKNMNVQVLEELKKTTRVKRWKAALGLRHDPEAAAAAPESTVSLLPPLKG